MTDRQADGSEPPCTTQRSPTDQQQEFLAVFTENWVRLVRFFGRLGCWEHAQDLAQETFLKIRHALDRVPDDPTNWKRWTLRIARNVFLDFVKHERCQRAAIERYVAERRGRRELDPVKGACVLDALATLPHEDQLILTLRFEEGLTAAEIAVFLDISEDAANGRLWRAMQALRRAWKEKLR